MNPAFYDVIYNGGDVGEAFGDNADPKYTYGGDVEEIINIIAGYMSSDDEESINSADEESNVIIGLAENNFDNLLKSLGGDEDDNKSDDTFTFDNIGDMNGGSEGNVINFDDMLDNSPEINEKLNNDKLDHDMLDNDNTYGAAETITLNKKDFLNYIKKILTYSN